MTSRNLIAGLNALDIEDAHKVVTTMPLQERRSLAALLSAELRPRQPTLQTARVLGLLQIVIAADDRAISAEDAEALLRSMLRLRNKRSRSIHQMLTLAISTVLARTIDISRDVHGQALDYLIGEAPRKGLAATSTYVRSLLRPRSRLRASALVWKALSGASSNDSADLDVQRAARNCTRDAVEDWYKDPWHWREIWWLGEGSNDAVLKQRLESLAVGRAVPMDVAKGGFATRPALILDALDRVLYQALVDACAPKLIADLPPWVFGWRLYRNAPTAGRYCDNGREWGDYRARHRAASSTLRYHLRADIRSCFSSISIEQLIDGVYRVIGNTTVVRRIDGYLRGWSEMTGRFGIPQRCHASSILCQFYLKGVDETVSRITASKSSKVLAIRWMDDISLYSDDRSALMSALGALVSAVGELGLELNAIKTVLGESANLSPVASGALEVTLPAFDLEEFFAEVSKDPREVERHDIARVCAMFRHNKAFERVKDLAAAADKMPQGADHLARVFRDSGQWRELERWFLMYAMQHRLPSDWSVQAWALMFPTGASGDEIRELADFFASELQNHRLSLIALPLACRRMRDWCAEDALDILRGSAEAAQTPFEMRALAFTAVSAGIARGEVESWLAGFPECSFSARFLRHYDYMPPKLAKDFMISNGGAPM